MHTGCHCRAHRASPHLSPHIHIGSPHAPVPVSAQSSIDLPPPDSGRGMGAIGGSGSRVASTWRRMSRAERPLSEATGGETGGRPSRAASAAFDARHGVAGSEGLAAAQPLMAARPCW